MLFSEFWGHLTARSKRILTVFAFFVLSIIVTIAGILTPLGPGEARAKSDELGRIRGEIEEMDLWHATSAIFVNNFELCLLMFIPIAGPLIGFYVLYNTGVFIGADSTLMGYPGLITLLGLFIFPFTWMEFIAYSTAFGASVWLVRRIVQRRGRKEVVRTFQFVLICALLLLVAAVIEAYLISLIV